MSWEKKLVNAFSGAIYPSYNDKFISGEKIPFSFYSNETSHKSIDSLTEFIKTTEPNTLLLSKN
ncbi:MAG: hypothetical protein LBC61_01330 [Candidatus Peribacteria bacterium]|nr:hypothetical protein [Candidatus Peribacteria bacterium]